MASILSQFIHSSTPPGEEDDGEKGGERGRGGRGCGRGCGRRGRWERGKKVETRYGGLEKPKSGRTGPLPHSFTRSLTHSRLHGKDIHVFELNASISYNVYP